MKKLSIEEKAKAYDEAIERAKQLSKELTVDDIIEQIFPELKESKDEKVKNKLIEFFKGYFPDEEWWENITQEDILAWLEKQGEIDKISYEIAEKEKREFVGDGFIKCYADFQDFKERETYWLEYVGNDNYNVRSDNLLGKTYYITPCQLYTIFKKQTWIEKQGEQKPLAWSEEDESMRIKCIGIFETYCAEDASRLITWFKSLKDRSTWKPSDRQMNVLEYYMHTLACNEHREILFGLYQDLKKLKE